jgi:hypothetical protein
MQVVQRRVLERVALLIGWNRDDDGSVDLADGELAALKPTEIENVGGRVEIDVGVGSPIPSNLGRRHGAPPGLLNSAAPPKSRKAWWIYPAPSIHRTRRLIEHEL